MDTNLSGRFRFNESDELVSVYFNEYISFIEFDFAKLSTGILVIHLLYNDFL